MKKWTALAGMMLLTAGCGEMPGQARWDDINRNDNGYIGNRDDGLQPQAVELPLGETPGQVTRSAPERRYWIDLEAEQTLQVEINFRHRKGNLDMMLHSQDRDFFTASVTETDREYLAVTAPQDATYFVTVAGLFGDENLYRMTARVLESGEAGCPGISGLPPTRISNRLDQTVWTYDRFCRGQVNEFQVELELGEDLELGLMFDHRRGQINLEVYDPQGELVLTGSGAPALKEARLESVLPGAYTIMVAGGAMDMPFTLSSKVVDPAVKVIDLDPVCGDLQDPGVTLQGRGDRVFRVEIQECSSWPEKMSLHVQLKHPGPEDYDLVALYGQDVMGNTAGDRLDVLELTHSSWNWGATNRTYLIAVVRKQHDSQVDPHPMWTLDLRGYTADW